MTILVTSVNFVVSVEVNFYPRYRDYYSLFNDGGVVGDIVVAEEEMLATLNRELRFCALKQLFVTAAVISLETTVLSALPLGFNNLMHGYFSYAVRGLWPVCRGQYGDAYLAVLYRL